MKNAPKRVFIELPTWLGDSVMASMAIESLIARTDPAQITFFGTRACLELYKNTGANLVVDESKKAKFRLIRLARIMRKLGQFDVAISFRGSFSAKFGFFFLKAHKKATFDKKISKQKWLNSTSNPRSLANPNLTANPPLPTDPNSDVNLAEFTILDQSSPVKPNSAAPATPAPTFAIFHVNSITPTALNSAPNSPAVLNSSPNSSLNSATPTHQAEKYALFAAEIFGFAPEFSRLRLRFAPRRLARATIALNPGASYGSAKRWYPRYFAQVGAAFAGDFDILILGGESESEICEQIAQDLARAGVKFTNLCRKTSVAQLCEIIGGVARSGGFFVTNDSGPMHIAAAYGARTIALFGPTRCDETAPYANENARVVRLELACMPCMRRVCPLGTHECMKNLTPERVIAVMRAEMERC